MRSDPWSDHIRHGFRRVVSHDSVEIVSIEIYDHRRKAVMHVRWRGKEVVLSLLTGTINLPDCENIGYQLGQNMLHTLMQPNAEPTR